MSQVPPAPHPRRLLRRIAPLIALAALMLVVTQVVLAAPPTANFSISDSTPNTGQDVDFSSTSTDPDEDILTYEWDFDYDGNFTSEATGANASTSYGTAGSYSVALRVTDDVTGDTTNDQSLSVKTITVSTPNQSPDGTFTFTPQGKVAGAQPDVGKPVAFTATGEDPDNDAITFEWSFGDGGTAVGQDVTHTFSSPGPKTVTLTVRDSRGGTGGDVQPVTVNSPPVAQIGIVNSAAEAGQKHNVPLAGQPFAFTAQAVPQLQGSPPAPGCPALLGSPGSQGSSDPDGSISTFEWDFDYNGTFVVDATGRDVPPPGGSYGAGSRTVALRLTDDNGGTDIAELTFRVNSPPTPGFVYEPFTPIVNQGITFSSTSADTDPADAGRLTYSWDLDNDGTFCESGENGPSVSHQFANADTSPGHRVRLVVTDEGGISRTVARNVIVQNTLPTASIGFAPDAPLPGQPVTFTGSAASPTGKAISGMQWDFDFDSSRAEQFNVDATGASVVHAFSSPGPKTVGLKVFEDGGGFAIVARTVNVNAAPRSGFTVAPESGFVGEPVTLSSTSADPDGPLVKQEWDLDNDGQFDDANAAVVSATFNGAGTHPLKLRVTDSRGATAVSTGQVTLRSRPLPVLTGVVISIKGRLAGRSTRVTRLLVRAPRGSRIAADCVGKRCPKKIVKRKGKGSKRVRIKKLERKFRPRIRLVVTVSRAGFIGKRTTFTIRRRKDPRRRDLCLVPGAKRASKCPPE